MVYLQCLGKGAIRYVITQLGGGAIMGKTRRFDSLGLSPKRSVHITHSPPPLSYSRYIMMARYKFVVGWGEGGEGGRGAMMEKMR